MSRRDWFQASVKLEHDKLPAVGKDVTFCILEGTGRLMAAWVEYDPIASTPHGILQCKFVSIAIVYALQILTFDQDGMGKLIPRTNCEYLEVLEETLEGLLQANSKLDVIVSKTVSIPTTADFVITSKRLAA